MWTWVAIVLMQTVILPILAWLTTVEPASDQEDEWIGQADAVWEATYRYVPPAQLPAGMERAMCFNIYAGVYLVAYETHYGVAIDCAYIKQPWPG